MTTLFGDWRLLLLENQKMLLCICRTTENIRRYTPSNMGGFERAVSESLFRTAIWRIEITEITGKRKKYDSQGIEM